MKKTLYPVLIGVMFFLEIFNMLTVNSLNAAKKIVDLEFYANNFNNEKFNLGNYLLDSIYFNESNTLVSLDSISVPSTNLDTSLLQELKMLADKFHTQLSEYSIADPYKFNFGLQSSMTYQPQWLTDLPFYSVSIDNSGNKPYGVINDQPVEQSIFSDLNYLKLMKMTPLLLPAVFGLLISGILALLTYKRRKRIPAETQPYFYRDYTAAL